MVVTQPMIAVDWLTPNKHAIQITFHMGWRWDDLYLAQQKANDYIHDENRVIDLVYYFPILMPLPKGYYTQLKRIAQRYPDNLGMVLWVGCNSTVIEMIRNVTVYEKELAYYYAFVDTLDEATQVVGP